MKKASGMYVLINIVDAGLQVSKALKMKGISVLMGGLRGGPPPL
jgi:hypothetical protein